MGAELAPCPTYECLVVCYGRAEPSSARYAATAASGTATPAPGGAGPKAAAAVAPGVEGGGRARTGAAAPRGAGAEVGMLAATGETIFEFIRMWKVVECGRIHSNAVLSYSGFK